MSYKTTAAITKDQDLLERVVACVAIEGDENPESWVRAHVWQIASQPGWGDKFAYAVAAGVGSPGQDEAVITDGDILAAVQYLRLPPEEPEPEEPVEEGEVT